jgi:hypothetical protein
VFEFFIQTRRIRKINYLFELDLNSLEFFPLMTIF